MTDEEFEKYLLNKPTIKGIVKEMKTWWIGDSDDDTIVQKGFDKILEIIGGEDESDINN